MAFATPAELSAYTNGLISATDPRADDILSGATLALQRLAGWHIAPIQTDTLLLDGASVGDILHLPSLAVRSIDAISSTWWGTTTVFDLAEVEWSANGNVRRRYGACWPEGFRNISVTFTHGYDEVPDLKQIVLQVSAQALSSPTGATREQAGQVSMQWATTAPGVAGGLSLLERDLETLAAYRLPKRI